MGIEPKRSVLQNLKNDAFCESPTAACDWRANFRVMRDNVGLRETTPPFAIEYPLSTLICATTLDDSVTIPTGILTRSAVPGRSWK